MSKGSSRRWLQRQARDPYVKQAHKDGYRSRAVYKLAELVERDKLFQHPHMRIVDLGAAPGGWSQWAQQQLQGTGHIVAVDLLPIEALTGVTFIQGDFTTEETLHAIQAALHNHKLDLVMSDMAPNISGIKSVDDSRAMLLAEIARDFALEWLKPGGDFITKVFHGVDFDAYVKHLRTCFSKVSIRKPQASRSESREVYVLARHMVYSSQSKRE